MQKFACLYLVVCVSGWIACAANSPENSGSSDNDDEAGTAGTGGEQNGMGGEGGQDQGGGQAGQQTSPPATGGGGGDTATPTGGAGSGGTAGAAMGGGAGASSTGGGAGTSTGGAPASPCAQLAHCDNFESYSAGSRPGGPWTGFEGGGSLVVDETRGFGGSKKSVKITATSGAGMTARMRHGGAGVLPADEIYLRMMVWMDAAPKGETGHWNWLWGEGNASQQSGGKLNNVFVASGGSQKSGRTWMLYGGDASGGYQDCFAQAQTRFPVGRWVCYEFHLNSKTNTGRSWIDGRLDELLRFENAQPLVGQCLPGHNFTDGKWFVPRIEKVFFGWKMYHTLDSAATAWIDDAAISTKRIGCPAN